MSEPSERSMERAEAWETAHRWGVCRDGGPYMWRALAEELDEAEQRGAEGELFVEAVVAIQEAAAERERKECADLCASRGWKAAAMAIRARGES